MSKLSEILLRLACLCALLSFPALAMAQEIGTDLICDTKEQISQFVSDFDGNTEATITKVNNGSNACGIVSLAFMEHEEVGNNQGTFRIVRITVVAVQTPMG